MSDTAYNAMASTTANTPGRGGGDSQIKDERSRGGFGGDDQPASSNTYVAMTPDKVQEVERVTPFTPEDADHMRRELGRDPSELRARASEAEGKMQARAEALQGAAPGGDLAAMAADNAKGAMPAPRARAEDFHPDTLAGEGQEERTALREWDVEVRQETRGYTEDADTIQKTPPVFDILA